jgi:formimidoylglutamate deiminase
VNAHSHAFQRALRGRVEGGDFWAWRDSMLALADAQTPERVRREYVAVYREMRAAGWTAVGEFHYLGFEEARAAAEAAEEAGIGFVLLLAAYGRGGLERFRQPSAAAYVEQVERLRADGIAVGVAPHSVRACPREWLEEIGRYADGEGLVLHVHADEQPREIEECLAEHGARVCLCPTTEANLGDGFAPVERLRDRGIPLCVGSDSNARIDPLEELREVEGIARRLTLRRNVVPPADLLAIGSSGGAAALGLDAWGDVEADPSHPSLAGIDGADLPAALVFGCSADVLTPV